MNFEYEPVNNVFRYLNTIELKSYLKDFEDKTIKDLMDKLELDFPYEDEHSESLFDSVAEDEFVDYLNERYNLNIKETIVSYYYIRL